MLWQWVALLAEPLPPACERSLERRQKSPIQTAYGQHITFVLAPANRIDNLPDDVNPEEKMRSGRKSRLNFGSRIISFADTRTVRRSPMKIPSSLLLAAVVLTPLPSVADDTLVTF